LLPGVHPEESRSIGSLRDVVGLQIVGWAHVRMGRGCIMFDITLVVRRPPLGPLPQFRKIKAFVLTEKRGLRSG